jgi:transglutaminase-like putative cysteine protease
VPLHRACLHEERICFFLAAVATAFFLILLRIAGIPARGITVHRACLHEERRLALSFAAAVTASSYLLLRIVGIPARDYCPSIEPEPFTNEERRLAF